MNILLGLVLGLLICFFLVVPSVKETSADSGTDTILALNEELEKAKEENAQLVAERDKIKSDLDEYANKADVTTSYDNLFSAQNSYNEGDTAAAAERIQLVTKDLLGPDGQKAYDTLYAQLGPTIVQGYYADGENFYKEENYDSAITNFQTVVDIDETYNNGAALFLLGDCYRLTGDTENAIKYFERVVELYSGNQWGKQAKTYLQADGTALEATEVED